MDYKGLKSSIKEISEVASSVPEQFRDKCFELLLNSLLAEHHPAASRKNEGHQREDADSEAKDNKETKHDSGTLSGTKIPLTAALRVLMQKTGVTQEELNKIVIVDGDEVHFVQTPATNVIIDGQIEWSLLLALKSAILKKALEADPEEVRSQCQNAGCYDPANFAANFKKPKFKKLFKDVLANQGSAVPLSPDGQEALGTLIKKLAGQVK
jgi:hypothetical protein